MAELMHSGSAAALDPTTVEEYSAANQVPTDANIAIFKAALAGSLTGVENALKKGILFCNISGTSWLLTMGMCCGHSYPQ
jgi:expansin (peptidoglycan-binding protein)